MNATTPDGRTGAPLRIAVAVQSLDTLGGKERDALAIAGALASRGHRVTLLTRSDAAPDVAPPAVALQRIEAPGWTNHGRARRFAQAAAEAGRSGDFDALLSFDKNGRADAWYAADVCLAARVGALKRRLPRYRTYLRLEAECLGPRGPQLLFLCRKQADEYRLFYGTRRHLDERTTILPPMIHVAPQDTFYARRDEMRCRFGVPPDAPLAVAVAIFGRQKGLDRTLAALRHIDGLYLVAVGLKDAAAMQTLAQRFGVAGRVRLDGRRDDVAEVLGSADLMLHPARVENTGLVIVESLLAGVPVIASATCGFAEYIERFGAGTVLAEPFGAERYAAAIAAALAPDRLRALRERARASAAPLRAEGGLERITDGVEAMLRQRAQARHPA